MLQAYDQLEKLIKGKPYFVVTENEDDVIFEYHITIHDEDFNLGILAMKTPEGTFEADFDA